MLLRKECRIPFATSENEYDRNHTHNFNFNGLFSLFGVTAAAVVVADGGFFVPLMSFWPFFDCVWNE